MDGGGCKLTCKLSTVQGYQKKIRLSEHECYHNGRRLVLQQRLLSARACLKNHSCNLHAPICGIFCLHSVDVTRYAALIQAKSPVNCNAHLAENIFQTRSSGTRFATTEVKRRPVTL